MLSYIAKTYIDSIDFKNCIQTSCSQISLCHQFVVLLVVVNCFLLLGQKDTVLKHFLPLKEWQLKEQFLNFSRWIAAGLTFLQKFLKLCHRGQKWSPDLGRSKYPKECPEPQEPQGYQVQLSTCWCQNTILYQTHLKGHPAAGSHWAFQFLSKSFILPSWNHQVVEPGSISVSCPKHNSGLCWLRATKPLKKHEG